MAWTNPPTIDDEWFRYDNHSQIDKALEERYAVAVAPLGRHNWPEGNIPWYTGTISAITATLLTDNTQTWATGRSSPYWYNYDPPGTVNDYLPSSYVIAIDVAEATEPWMVVKANITGAESGNDLPISDISDYVTAGAIPSLASLVGKTYRIITGPLPTSSEPGFGLTWADRVSDYPNDREHFIGTTTRGSNITLTELLESTGDRAGLEQEWTVDQFAGNDVLVYGSDGRLHRETIAGNTINTLRWAGTTPPSLTLEFLNTITDTFTLAFDTADGIYKWSSGDDYFTLTVVGDSFTGGGQWTDPADSTVYTTDFAGSITADVFAVTGAGAYGAQVTGTRPSTWYPTGAYSITDAGDRVWPGKTEPLACWDYGGYREKRASRYPGGIGMNDIAAASIRVMEFNPSTSACELGPSHPAFDVDFITRDDQGCEPYDKFWAPDLFKTPRGKQIALRGLVSQFIEAKTYHAQDDIHKFTLAEFWKKATVNWGDSTVQGPDGSGNYHFTVDTAYVGHAVAWTILDTVGTVAATEGGSFSTVAAAGKVTLGGAEWATHVGKAVVYSAGETRRYPRRHRYMFAKTHFIPDTYTVGGATLVADPPEVIDFALTGSLGVGMWNHRAASTNYAEYDQYGQLTDSGAAFVLNDASLYEGDDWPHGTLGMYSTDDSGDLLLPYWHKAVTHTQQPAQRLLITRQQSGDATDGSDRTLTDTTQNWWSDWYDDSGLVLHTESGTATAGGGSDLTDSTKDITLEDGQFWIAERFNGFSAPYVGFVIEVQEPTVGAWHRRVITGCTFSSNVPTVTWAAALPFATAGCAYRIREPQYEINRWQGRKLRLRYPDGSTAVTTITHSDDVTLYFPALATPVTAGTAYEIEDPELGTVWQFETSEPAADRTSVKIATGQWWVKPVGTDDSPRDGTPADWETDAHNNLPTIVTAYGLARRGDMLPLGFWQEMYRGLNALRWTEGGGTYYPSAVDSVPENNAGSVFIDSGPRSSPDDSDERAAADAEWAAASPWGVGGNMPLALTEVAMDEEFVSIWMDKVFAYYEPAVTTNVLAHNAETLIYAGVDFVDTPESDDQDPPELSTVEFKANGSGTLYHKFASMDEQMVLAGATSTTRVLIGTALSTPPEFGRSIPISDTPPELGYTDQVTAGWYPVRTLVINKWDVSGGFTYVD